MREVRTLGDGLVVPVSTQRYSAPYRESADGRWILVAGEWYNLDEKYLHVGNLRRKLQKSLKTTYRNRVRTLTNRNKHLVEGIEHRDWDTMHVDHKISIMYGFKNGIPPEDIAHPSNLHMLSADDNMKKRDECIVDEYNSWIVPRIL